MNSVRYFDLTYDQYLDARFSDNTDIWDNISGFEFIVDFDF
ncbi:MAG: hypothetical protein O6939_02675 [Bacteroidetes bacterium]|nr:hypothetical protein [Bacteroidota bacterium]